MIGLRSLLGGLLSAILGGVVVVAASVGKLSSFARTGCDAALVEAATGLYQWAPASTLKRMKMGVIDF